MISAGARAPDFTAMDQDGNQVSLVDFRGKSALVLYFYPKDFTPGCTMQACSFRDHLEEIRGLGAEVLGIAEGSAEKHRKFAKSFRLGFPLLCDEGGAIARAYGLTRFGGLLPARRATFIIGRDGIVRGVFHFEIRIWKHASETLAALRR